MKMLPGVLCWETCCLVFDLHEVGIYSFYKGGLSAYIYLWKMYRYRRWCILFLDGFRVNNFVGCCSEESSKFFSGREIPSSFSPNTPLFQVLFQTPYSPLQHGGRPILSSLEKQALSGGEKNNHFLPQVCWQLRGEVDVLISVTFCVSKIQP